MNTFSSTVFPSSQPPPTFHSSYQTQTIDSCHTQWRSNCKHLYSNLSLFLLPTPTNTFQWIPKRTLNEDGSEVHCRCIVGTSLLENNFLRTLKVVVQTETSIDSNEYEIKKQQMEVEITQNSSVVAAKVNPSKTSLIASKCSGGYPQLNIFDLSDVSGENQEPLIRLQNVGECNPGRALDWNKQKHNILASGSSDGRICIWDIEKSKETDSVLMPVKEYGFHKGGVRDISWNKKNGSVFLTCGEDAILAIWDTRESKSSTSSPTFQKHGHPTPIPTIDFSPHSQMLFLSGGSLDCQIGLWDLRNISKRIHTFTGHSQPITKVQWCPHNRHLFASCSNDRRAVIWDDSKCGELDEYEEPAEIVFIHSGHKTEIVELDWAPERYVVGTVDTGGGLQVWRMPEGVGQGRDQGF